MADPRGSKPSRGYRGRRASGVVSDGAHAPSGGGFRVIVRVRPMLRAEARRGLTSAVAVPDGRDVVQVTTAQPTGLTTVQPFRFDTVVGPSLTQLELYTNSRIQSLLDSALCGFGCTVFAYGQTGSGKTYTMSGEEERVVRPEYSGADENDGLISRSARYLFETIEKEEREGAAKTLVRAAYCEIYNEQVFDLLNPTNEALPVRWSASAGGFFVQDLVVVTCDSLEDIVAAISEGHRNRTVGSHALNKDSSRSHSLLFIHLDRTPCDGGPTTHGKVVFTDLAGSERLKETKSAGVARRETGQINKSLFTLGKVISTLELNGHGSAPSKHVPYRDSKLTKLLMDSLGGSSMTLMIACVAPGSEYVDESMSTLQYATRAANIKNDPIVKMDPTERLIAQLRHEIRILRLENEHLRAQGGGGGGASPVVPPLRMEALRGSSSSESKDPPVLPPLVSSAPSSRPSSGTSTGRGGRAIAKSASHSGRSPSKRSSADEVILAQYKQELLKLAREMASMRSDEALRRKQYNELMAENDRLRDKLERLEVAFAGDPTSGASWEAPTPRVSVGGAADRENAQLRAAVRRLEAELAFMREGDSGSEAAQGGGGGAAPAGDASEIRALREKLATMQHREVELIKQLTRSTRGPSR